MNLLFKKIVFSLGLWKLTSEIHITTLSYFPYYKLYQIYKVNNIQISNKVKFKIYNILYLQFSYQIVNTLDHKHWSAYCWLFISLTIHLFIYYGPD